MAASDPNSDLNDAVARGDATAAGETYAREGKLLAPSTDVIEGRADIESYWEAGIALGLSRIAREPLSVETAEEVAIEIGRYQLEIDQGGGDRVVEEGKYLAVHAQQADGTTRRTFDVFSPDVPRARSGNEKNHEGGRA